MQRGAAKTATKVSRHLTVLPLVILTTLVLGLNPRLVDCEAEAEVYNVIELQRQAHLPPFPHADEPPKVQDLKCKWHTGSPLKNVWSCCGFPAQDKTLKGCRGRVGHEPKIYGAHEIEQRWQYRKTPSPKFMSGARAAIAFDCEMGTATTGDSELIRVSVVDYFTGETLVDSLVYPNVQMQHYNTKYSGVTRGQMEHAWRTGTCFFGKESALDAIWRFVDEKTVVIGHSVQNDLTAMRWIHPILVDSYIIEETILRHKLAEEVRKLEAEKRERIDDMLSSGMTGSEVDMILAAEAEAEKAARKIEAEEKSKAREAGVHVRTKGTGALGLKVLTKARVGRDVQMGKSGHDSVEDALATRDLVLWHVENALKGRKGKVN
jgi:RNA exonuclease 1